MIIKNTKAPIRRRVLNLLSQYSPMKNAATKYALPKAIISADIISKGAGSPRLETTTVSMVRINNAVPTDQSCFTEET